MKKQHLLIVLCVLMLTLFTACGHTHEYGGWKTEKKATCEKEGRKVRKCDCGDEEEEKIPKLEHTYGEWKVKTAATCTEEGTQEHTCEACGNVEEGKLPKAEHAYENAVGSASCQNTGTVEQVCKDCGDTRTENATSKTYTATELYELYKNSVGEIVTYDRNGQGLSLGSCFVQTADGKLITNYHVIKDAYSAKVTFGDQTYVIQKVLAYDKNIDAAVLQISAANLKPVTLCELEHKVGETVYAFGSSKGLTATFSDGMITHSKRESGGVTYVQHSAPISSGNSGGPLINTYGEVIGINTLTLKDSQNLNFAVCISELKNLDYSNPMSMSQFYEEENNAYKKLANYIMAEGRYSDGSYSLNLKDGYVNSLRANCLMYAMYFPDDGLLWIVFCADGSEFVYISLDADVSGVYEWGYFDDKDYDMEGTLTASTFTSNTLLGYYSDNLPTAAKRSEIRELASDMMTILCNNLSSGLEEISVTAADLGFTNFQ